MISFGYLDSEKKELYAVSISSEVVDFSVVDIVFTIIDWVAGDTVDYFAPVIFL